MITAAMFEHLDPKQHANSFAYTISALALTARLALENETSGTAAEQVKVAAVATTLEVIEVLASVVIDGSEHLETRLRRADELRAA